MRRNSKSTSGLSLRPTKNRAFKNSLTKEMYGNETDEVKKEVEAYRKQLAKGNMIKLEGNNEDDDEDDPMDDEAQERMNQQMQL